jgi:hypothetical protein
VGFAVELVACSAEFGVVEADFAADFEVDFEVRFVVAAEDFV